MTVLRGQNHRLSHSGDPHEISPQAAFLQEEGPPVKVHMSPRQLYDMKTESKSYFSVSDHDPGRSQMQPKAQEHANQKFSVLTRKLVTCDPQ